MNKVIAEIVLEQSMFNANTGEHSIVNQYKILVACKFPNVSDEILRTVYENGNIIKGRWNARAIGDLVNNQIIVNNNGQYEFSEQFRNIIKKLEECGGFSVNCVKSIEKRLHELTREREQFHLV